MFLSIIRTFTPFSARSLAAMRPLGPPPTTITSESANLSMSLVKPAVTAFSEDFSNIAILCHQLLDSVIPGTRI